MPFEKFCTDLPVGFGDKTKREEERERNCTQKEKCRREGEAGEWELQEKLDNKKADKDIKRIQLKF